MHFYPFQTKIGSDKVSLTLMPMETKILLSFILILKIVDMGNVNIQCMGHIHNDLISICLGH